MRNFVAYLIPTILVGVLASLIYPDLYRVPTEWVMSLPQMGFLHKSEIATPQPASVIADTARGRLTPVHMGRPGTMQLHLSPPPGEEREPQPEPIPYPPAPETHYWPQSNSTVVPVHVSTKVRLSGTADDDTLTADDPSELGPDGKISGPWPVLCGEVVDSDGVAIEDASVEIESIHSVERTDAKGHFCMPCPNRHLTIRVSAQRRGSVDYPVRLLNGPMTQVRVTLPSAP